MRDDQTPPESDVDLQNAPRDDAYRRDADVKTDRRALLRAVGAGVGAAALLPGSISATGSTTRLSLGTATDDDHGSDDNEAFPPKGTTWGPADCTAGATIQTFARVAPSGKPTHLGVWFDAALLENLPSAEELGSPPAKHWHLGLPAETGTNFTFVGMEWNPLGHEPPGIYDVPHFDAHFYLLPEKQVADIPGGPVDYELPPERTPTGYVRAPPEAGGPMSVPGMGEHLFDPTGAEFGGEFTNTLIWGATDADDDGVGEPLFVEPMFAKAFLDSKPDECRPVATPEAFTDAGYYPTEYCIRYHGNADAFTVTLESFERFEAFDASSDC